MTRIREEDEAKECLLFVFAATVAQLEQHNSNTEDELKARVSDIHSLQNALNNSQHEYSKLEHLLKAAQQDSAQQQVKHIIASHRHYGGLQGKIP